MKKKAEEYLKNLDDCRTKELMKQAYLDGLVEGRKELVKENAELKEQNEKMKHCGNCINRGLGKYFSHPRDRCKRWHRKENYNDYWELAE